MYNYIPHPSNARQASMCVSLLIEEGFAGYGLYWAILEVLRDAPSYRYSPEPKVWAYVLHATDVAMVERVLNKYGLFDTDDDGLLFSPWLCEQLDAYDEQKQRRSAAGKRGAARRWGGAASTDGNAMAMPSQEDGNAMAYNTISHNVTKNNITNPTQADGQDWRSVLSSPVHKISEEAFSQAAELKTYSSTAAYLFQECYRRGVSFEAFSFILEASDGAKATNPTYKAFVALCRRVDAEKYPVKLPDNFYLSKLFG